jgi:hypothetical protein
LVAHQRGSCRRCVLARAFYFGARVPDQSFKPRVGVHAQPAAMRLPVGWIGCWLAEIAAWTNAGAPALPHHPNEPGAHNCAAEGPMWAAQRLMRGLVRQWWRVRDSSPGPADHPNSSSESHSHSPNRAVIENQGRQRKAIATFLEQAKRVWWLVRWSQPVARASIFSNPRRSRPCPRSP